MPKLLKTEEIADEIKFVTFANDKTWPVKGNFVEALVSVEFSDFTRRDLEGFLDFLVEEAVGDISVMDINYENVAMKGPSTILLKVTGDVSDIIENPEDSGIVIHVPDSDALFDALAEQYGWNEFERSHARGSKDAIYVDENSIILPNGREIRFSNDGDYVRVVQAGHELMYWVCDEWKEAPQEVMGAILGCAKGTSASLV